MTKRAILPQKAIDKSRQIRQPSSSMAEPSDNEMLLDPWLSQFLQHLTSRNSAYTCGSTAVRSSSSSAGIKRTERTALPLLGQAQALRLPHLSALLGLCR